MEGVRSMGGLTPLRDCPERCAVVRSLVPSMSTCEVGKPGGGSKRYESGAVFVLG